MMHIIFPILEHQIFSKCAEINDKQRRLKITDSSLSHYQSIRHLSTAIYGICVQFLAESQIKKLLKKFLGFLGIQSALEFDGLSKEKDERHVVKVTFKIFVIFI